MASDLSKAGTRVIYWSAGGAAKMYRGTVTGGPCDDPECSYVHVDVETGGDIHHVPPARLRLVPLPCFRCHRDPAIQRDGAYVTVWCEDCYDGVPDSSTRNEIGASCTGVADALAEWNEKMEERAE